LTHHNMPRWLPAGQNFLAVCSVQARSQIAKPVMKTVYL